MEHAAEMKAYKIKKVYVADILCDSIKENIISGAWKVGEKLPTEHELAGLFGVNRMTVRTALQKLNTLGVLETRVGDGTYVCSFDFSKLLDTVSDFYATPQLLKGVSEFRKAVEIPCAMLAIDNASPGEVAELAAILEQIKDTYSHVMECIDPEDSENGKKLAMDMASIDLVFHEQICKMSHNKLLYYSFLLARESIYQFMVIVGQQRMDKWKREKGEKSEKGDENVTTHLHVYEAIYNKDKETCAKLLNKMYDHSYMGNL